jgi:hypothetical protein
MLNKKKKKHEKRYSLKKIAVAAAAAFYLITRMNYGGLLKSWFASTYEIGFCGLKQAQKMYKFYVQIHNYNFQFFFSCFIIFYGCFTTAIVDWDEKEFALLILSKLNLNAIFYGL